MTDAIFEGETPSAPKPQSSTTTENFIRRRHRDQETESRPSEVTRVRLKLF
jgi:hypothetical protein